MKIEFRKNYIAVFREPGDPAYYGVSYAAGESALLYAIKKKLNSMGYGLIKKRMHKDGHLVSEMQQYLRTRKPSGDPEKDIYLYNGAWAVRGIEADFNKGGCRLELVKGIFANKNK